MNVADTGGEGPRRAWHHRNATVLESGSAFPADEPQGEAENRSLGRPGRRGPGWPG